MGHNREMEQSNTPEGHDYKTTQGYILYLETLIDSNNRRKTEADPDNCCIGYDHKIFIN